MDKQSLREQYIAARNTLLPDYVQHASEQIAERLLRFDPYVTAQSIMFYLSMTKEVQTDALLLQALAKHKTVAVPYFLPQKGHMGASVIHDLEELMVSRFNLRVPIAPEPCSPETIDVVIVPGVCFDRRGGRIGFGAGYYDRFLAQTSPDALRIAVAFDCQLTSTSVPMEPTDQFVDYIMTEKEWVRTGARD